MAEALERRAMGFLNRVRTFVAILRWGSRDLVLALSGFAALSVAAALTRLPKDWQALIPSTLRPWLPVPLWLAGGLLLGLVALRSYRRVVAPLPETAETKLPALKGAASFTPDDAELFAQLGRGDELEQLRAWILDDQRPLIVLMGESGVGKTSLLRAGLAHAIKNDGLDVIYWEALPSNPEAELLYVLRSAWGKGKAPGDLATVPEAIVGADRVVVLDQFEQISPETHPALFDLLRTLLSTPPPYRGTVIVAFRREYMATWSDFTLELPAAVRNNRIEILSLRGFPVATARRTVTVLATAAGLPVDQQVVDTLVQGLAVNGRVSPVDLGVSLLGLGELVSAEGAARVSLDNFRESEVPAGLLRRYLERQLALISPLANRDEILSALLTLVDLQRNQRWAEGRSLQELVEQVKPVSPSLFEAALTFLVKARILEFLIDPERSATRYRLLHERFIEPVRVLSGTLLATATQAFLRLDEAHRAWSHDRRHRYLLSGSDLSLVLKYQGQFSWGEGEADKRSFLRLSVRQRNVRRAFVSTALVAALIAGAEIEGWLDRRELSLQFASWGIPGDLGEHLEQLEKLTIGQDITNLAWLSKAEKLRSLSVTAQISTDATLPSHLEEFTCNCSGVGHIALNPSLHSLDLDSNAPSSLVLPANLRELSLPYWPHRFPPGLSSFTVVMDRLESSPPLPNSLQSLTIHIRNFAYLNQNFAKLLPRKLKEVSLTNVGLPSPESLAWLPADLTALMLSVPHEGSREISLLPQNLRNLNLDGDAIRLSPKNLPPNLQSLTLQGFQPDHLTQLNLEHLQHLEILRFANSDLPKLALSGKHLGIPPQVRTLVVDLQLLKWLRLPVGLKDLRILAGDTDIVRLGDLPRSLESLDLSFATVDNLHDLPPNLSSLRISLSQQSAEDLHLPDTLKALALYDVSSYHGAFLENLPPHLLSLTISGTAPLNLKKLPRDLNVLEISALKTAPYRDLQGLPKHLERLALHSYAVQSLRGLPNSVKELRISSF